MTPEFSYFTMPLSAIMCAWHNSFPLLIAISRSALSSDHRTGRLRREAHRPGQRGGLFGSVVWCGQCFEASELLQSEWDLAVDLDYWDYEGIYDCWILGGRFFIIFRGLVPPRYCIQPAKICLTRHDLKMSGAMWAWWIQHPMGCPWDAHEMPMGCLVGIRCPRLTCHTLGQPPSLRPRFWLANGAAKSHRLHDRWYLQ